MLPFLGPEDEFPPTNSAWGAQTDAPGLLCAGADLSPQRLLSAYRGGIFPWYSEGQPILWWSTHPRMVLRPAEFHLPHSLGKRIRQVLREGWLIEIDRATPRVIEACAHSPRPGQSGTWIVRDIQLAYQRLASLGHVHSVEVWREERLLGGLYCVNIGRAVFGESMFYAEKDASKLALCALVALCKSQGVELIDCQQQTDHLARFGAKPIHRDDFIAHLQNAVTLPPPQWQFNDLYWRELF
jgi:leucyl/phenylalanyl-tRNA---protein transferase